MMHGYEKSDLVTVAMKPANKAEGPSAAHAAEEIPAAEPVERRAGTKGNADQQSTRRTQGRESVSQALERIRKVARERKQEKFTALFHHISTELLEEAFFELNPAGIAQFALGLRSATRPPHAGHGRAVPRSAVAPGNPAGRCPRTAHHER